MHAKGNKFELKNPESLSLSAMEDGKFPTTGEAMESEINDSPIEQVRLTVPITDDSTSPILTFRTWILGPVTCAILAFVGQFFNYRQNPIRMSDSCFQMLLVVLGNLMAATLPSKPVKVPGTRWTFSMNPGPFTIKEHVLLSILVTSGLDNPYSTVIVTVKKIYYNKSVNFWAAFLMILTSQLLGYGFAGIFMKFLVNNPYMWYPFTLISVSFYRSMHEVEKRIKGGITKFQFFLVATIASFAYAAIPGYFFPSLGALSVVCWFWKNSVIAQIIGSGRNGFGIGSFVLDWNAVGGYLGNPFAYPLSTIVNTSVGFILFLYIMAPIAYWTNTYNARRFPFSSYDFYDKGGQLYNVSKILNEADLTFNEKGYQSYSISYWSVVYLFSIGFDFATCTSSVTHFIFFHGREAWQQFKQAYGSRNNTGDVHSRLMKKYKPVPQWWFGALMIIVTGLAILSCEGFGNQLQLPYWGILLSCLLVVIFILPIGVLEATTGSSFSLNVIAEVLIGYIYPGRPMGNMVFKAFTVSTNYHALAFISDFKLAHYMKIPPRSMFVVQLTGTIISSIVSFATTWWLISSVDNICHPEKLPKGSPWTCPGISVSYGGSLIWGVIGPQRILYPDGVYSKLLCYFLLMGAISTLLVWGLSKFFPGKEWVRSVNIPNIITGAGTVLVAGPASYWSWIVLGTVYNLIVYRKYKRWWAKYNYVLAYGLDMGVAFLSLLTSLTLGLSGIYGVNWWGLDVGDHCPLAQCPTAPGVSVDGCPTVY